MPRGKSSDGDIGGEKSDGAVGPAGNLLRELAERADHDPAFGAQVADALRASGLLGSARKSPPPRKKSVKSVQRAPKVDGNVLNPFQVLRRYGDQALRDQLTTLDLTSLRQIVRAHRLDPARISARWSSSERVVSLIVEQVRARANHGRAFESI